MTINESNARQYNVRLTRAAIYKVDFEKSEPESLPNYSNNSNSMDKDSRGKNQILR